jgi:predicted DNA-binding ribbon-helix-helix protein
MAGGKLVSIRLEAYIWGCLDEIATETGKAAEDIIAHMANTSDRRDELASAIREFVLSYYKKILAERPVSSDSAILNTLRPRHFDA